MIVLFNNMKNQLICKCGNKFKPIIDFRTGIVKSKLCPNCVLKAKNMKIFSKNKYNSKRTKYNGRYYDSAMEAAYAEKLDFRKKNGEIKEIIPQFKISIDINGEHIANYYMDFKVILSDGRIEMHEVKGAETQLWRMKWRLSKALHPEWNFILIKQIKQ